MALELYLLYLWVRPTIFTALGKGCEIWNKMIWAEGDEQRT